MKTIVQDIYGIAVKALNTARSGEVVALITGRLIQKNEPFFNYQGLDVLVVSL